MLQGVDSLPGPPFGVTPDTQYLFDSATHREALASMLYGVKTNRGFIALIAKPGMGKTTLLFESLKRFQHAARTAFVFQTASTPVDFLRILLTDLGVGQITGYDLVELQAKLTKILTDLARQGKQLIVAVDEAQGLDNSVLEFIRMLSNFETSRGKLMQIILSGQPGLAQKLASPELIQLRQRISIVAHLDPLSPAETALYIRHRLQVRGYRSVDPVFTPEATRLIAQQSGGIPRNINNLCFNALSLGRALKKTKIDVGIVREVIADLDLRPLTGMKSGSPKADRHRIGITSNRAFRKWIPRTVIASMALGFLSMIVPFTQRRVTAETDTQRAKPLMALVREITEWEIARLDLHRTKPLGIAPSLLSVNAAQRDILAIRAGSVPSVATSTLPEGIVQPGMKGICPRVFAICYPDELDKMPQLRPSPFDSNAVGVSQRISIPPSIGLSALSMPAIHSFAANTPQKDRN
jgi:type II secretory pathway predicted ATPase ExeA